MGMDFYGFLINMDKRQSRSANWLIPDRVQSTWRLKTNPGPPQLGVVVHTDLYSSTHYWTKEAAGDGQDYHHRFNRRSSPNDPATHMENGTG